MKTLQTLLLAGLLNLGFMASAQDYTFKVLASMGRNQVNTGAGWVTIKTGQKLHDSDQIKLPDNSYIGLLHSSGGRIEIKEGGTYKVQDLEGKVKKPSSAAKKYSDYLADQMSSKGSANRLSATGAVHRALGGEDITVFMPNSVKVFKDVAVLRWEPLEGKNVVYHVTLMNMFEEILLSEETSETYFVVDLADEKLAGQPNLLFSVANIEDESQKSELIALNQLSADSRTKIEQEWKVLMEGVENVSALDKYLEAGFFEQQELLMDALTSFEEAIELAPEVEEFKVAYEEFLLRNGLKKAK